MIKNQDGLDFVVFPREKTNHMRVNVLWKETKQALDDYIREYPNGLEYVFTSEAGTMFNPHDIQRCFRRLADKVGVDKDVMFCHMRDGAATALFGKVSSDLFLPSSSMSAT